MHNNKTKYDKRFSISSDDIDLFNKCKDELKDKTREELIIITSRFMDLWREYYMEIQLNDVIHFVENGEF